MQRHFILPEFRALSGARAPSNLHLSLGESTLKLLQLQLLLPRRYFVSRVGQACVDDSQNHGCSRLSHDSDGLILPEIDELNLSDCVPSFGPR